MTGSKDKAISNILQKALSDRMIEGRDDRTLKACSNKHSIFLNISFSDLLHAIGDVYYLPTN